MLADEYSVKLLLSSFLSSLVIVPEILLKTENKKHGKVGLKFESMLWRSDSDIVLNMVFKGSKLFAVKQNSKLSNDREASKNIRLVIFLCTSRERGSV